MGKLGYLVLGLAIVLGALAFAGHRHLPGGLTGLPTPTVVTRGATPAAAPSALPSSGTTQKTKQVSGLKLFDMSLNIANVLVGILGIWMTMRGMRAERRADRRS